MAASRMAASLRTLRVPCVVSSFAIREQTKMVAVVVSVVLVVVRILLTLVIMQVGKKSYGKGVFIDVSTAS